MAYAKLRPARALSPFRPRRMRLVADPFRDKALLALGGGAQELLLCDPASSNHSRSWWMSCSFRGGLPGDDELRVLRGPRILLERGMPEQVVGSVVELSREPPLKGGFEHRASAGPCE